MKKLLYVLAMLTFTLNVAQTTKSYKLPISLMIQYAQNDFKDILGDKLESIPDLESAYYKPKEIIGIGSESLIKSDNSDKTFYICSALLLSEQTSQFIEDALKVVNDGVQAGKFSGRDYTDEKGRNITEVYQKDNDVVIRLISSYDKDADDDNNTFSMMIYGNTLGKIMK